MNILMIRIFIDSLLIELVPPPDGYFPHRAAPDGAEPPRPLSLRGDGS